MTAEKAPSMLVVGSVAFDTLHLPSGHFARVLGGSAVYASLCASYLTDVHLVGVAGRDFPDDAIALLRRRGIGLEGLEIVDGLTFHWEGRYSSDLASRTTLRTDLNVLADFRPNVPERLRHAEYVMLGNVAPELQLEVLDQMVAPKLVVADTMNFWIDGALDALKEVLKRIDVLVINEEEAHQLSKKRHVVAVAGALLELGPKTVIIKRGEYGALLFAGDEVFSAPGFPLPDVVDPTGAGDSFAGGFLGYLAATRDHTEARKPARQRAAVIHGSALASLCVEGVGPKNLADLTPAQLRDRVGAFRKLVEFA